MSRFDLTLRSYPCQRHGYIIEEKTEMAYAEFHQWFHFADDPVAIGILERREGKIEIDMVADAVFVKSFKFLQEPTRIRFEPSSTVKGIVLGCVHIGVHAQVRKKSDQIMTLGKGVGLSVKSFYDAVVLTCHAVILSVI